MTKMQKQLSHKSAITFLYLYYVNSIPKEEEHESV
jgi:hypothetical protein